MIERIQEPDINPRYPYIKIEMSVCLLALRGSDHWLLCN